VRVFSDRNRDAASVIVPGGLLREEMFELSGRRCDSSQWT
jgi:hypothetical protein